MAKHPFRNRGALLGHKPRFALHISTNDNLDTIWINGPLTDDLYLSDLNCHFLGHDGVEVVERDLESFLANVKVGEEYSESSYVSIAIGILLRRLKDTGTV
jgi:hypothetical protein